jgi:hypothetical protein
MADLLVRLLSVTLPFIILFVCLQMMGARVPFGGIGVGVAVILAIWFIQANGKEITPGNIKDFFLNFHQAAADVYNSFKEAQAISNGIFQSWPLWKMLVYSFYILLKIVGKIIFYTFLGCLFNNNRFSLGFLRALSGSFWAFVRTSVFGVVSAVSVILVVFFTWLIMKIGPASIEKYEGWFSAALAIFGCFLYCLGMIRMMFSFRSARDRGSSFGDAAFSKIVVPIFFIFLLLCISVIIDAYICGWTDRFVVGLLT